MKLLNVVFGLSFTVMAIWKFLHGDTVVGMLFLIYAQSLFLENGLRK